MSQRALRQLQRLLTMIELAHLPEPGSTDVARDSIALTWAGREIKVRLEPPRTWHVSVVPGERGRPDPGDPTRWRLHADSATTTLEMTGAAVAGRIGRYIGGSQNSGSIEIDGVAFDEWLREHPPEVAELRRRRAAEPHATPVRRLPQVKLPAETALHAATDDTAAGAGAHEPWLGLTEDAAADLAWARHARGAARRAGPPDATPVPIVNPADLADSALRPSDALGVRSLLAETVLAEERTPARDVGLRALCSSQVVSMEPSTLVALGTSEAIPPGWVHDIRLPLPAVSALVTGRVDVPVTVDGADVELLGFTLLSGPDGELLDQVLWHLVVDGDLAVRRGDAGKARFQPLVRNTAAWLGTHRAVRPPKGHRVGASATTGRPRPPSRVIRIGPSVASPPTLSGRGAAVAAHQRRGHWKRVRCGPREDWHYELRWIPPTFVGLGAPGPTQVWVLPLPGS